MKSNTSNNDKKRCPHCWKLLTKSYLKTHIKKQHPKKFNYKIDRKSETLDDEELFDLCQNFEDLNLKSDNDNVLESEIQKKLEKRYKCGHFSTPAGIIDILDTNNHCIIEIKHWRAWKHAIGQLICYNYYYPNYMMKVHFFGKIPEDSKKIVILTICANNKIAVSWEK